MHPNYIPGDNNSGTSNFRDYRADSHGTIQGDFVEIRRGLDYSWHTNYTLERQRWQDRVLRRVATSQAPQEGPWLIFTCGAMGAGKGHVMEWLSKNGIFPLESIVHIDPDYFKSVMPEWSRYTQTARLEAGTLCHKESAFMQEIALEVAMRGSQHTWVDGSLRDFVWYSKLIDQIRRSYSQYRIAIIYVRCSAYELIRRIKRRGEQTGRWISEAIAIESLRQTAKSIEVLGPQADLVAIVDNEHETPRLEAVHHQSHSFSFLKHVLNIGAREEFPSSLRALSVERDQMLTEFLVLTPAIRATLTSPSFGMHAMPLAEGARPLLHSLLRPVTSGASLLLSPAARVNLDLHSRRNANIPDSAEYFLVSHGAVDSVGRLLPLRGLEACEEIQPLLHSICFIYTDSVGEIVGVNILSQARTAGRRNFLRCDGPERLSSDVEASLLQTGRWLPRVPLECVSGADAMAWLLPGELKECPFGGFAFLFSETHALPNIYFPIAAS